jgi:predicted dehydrogenase
MRLAFIGGFGHHYLRPLPKEAAAQVELPVAWAPAAKDDAGHARIAEFAGELKRFDDPIQMLDQFKPDVLSVGAIFGQNGDFVFEALRRGIGVVSDKPIAATWEQLDRIRAAAKQSGRSVLTEFDFRSRREFRAARELVRGGQIGAPVLVTAQKSYRFGTRPGWYADRALYGGTMLWIASHAIDAIAFTTEKKFRRVIGQQGNLSQPGFGSMEDHCTALFELEGGATGLVHADYLRPAGAPTHGDDRLRIAGTKGVAEVRGGRCIFIDRDGERDVTESVSVQPIHLELLAALRGEDRDLYSTEKSLEMAATLLHARDAADARTWVECSARI